MYRGSMNDLIINTCAINCNKVLTCGTAPKTQGNILDEGTKG